MTDPLWRGKTKPVAAFLDGPPTSRIAASLLVPPGTEVEVWPAGDRTPTREQLHELIMNTWRHSPGEVADAVWALLHGQGDETDAG